MSRSFEISTLLFFLPPLSIPHMKHTTRDSVQAKKTMQQHLTIVTAPICGPQTALHELRVPQKKLQRCSQEIKSAEEQHKVISSVTC